MKAVWVKDLFEEKNVTLAFSLDLEKKENFALKLAAASCYRIYLDGKFIGFGPQRAAKGYARWEEIRLMGKRLVIEVESLFVNSFWIIKQPPFFACEIVTDNGKKYEAKNFSCQRLTDRLQKVQKYSYQRGFAETYKMKTDRRSLYNGNGYDAPYLNTESVEMPTLLHSLVDRAKYNLHFPKTQVEEGIVTVDGSLPVWRDRTHVLIGTTLEGYTIEEWEDALSDETSQFVYHPSLKTENAKYLYRTLDFSRAITGFTEMKIKAKKNSVVYVMFDEILWHERGRGENHVSFDRNTTTNVFKWQFTEEGEYHVSTFEPYTCRYACIVYSEGVEFEISIRDYENPNVGRMQFTCTDDRAEKIMSAAQATLAQNAVDLLTDCPSRERAGWLSDSWFSSVAEKLFTGENQAESAFLDNYAKSKSDVLPKGMIHMCYPSDEINQEFIPNWALWYIYEIAKYANANGIDDVVLGAKEKVFGILGYFKDFENEIGLLEDLVGWIFVEWSAANEASHICGVNVPSNMEYAACLEVTGKIYNVPEYIEKAQKIRAKIKEIAFDGKFFVDNLVRDENGVLKQTGLLTEVCQYYAFWFNCVTPEEYPELFQELMENLGGNRQEGYLPEMERPNVMYGTYMRIDLLMRQGERKQIYDECMKLFGQMAERTGTLWEHNSIFASCNHGFAAYAAKWLIYALTGYDCMTGNRSSKCGIGIDCQISLPINVSKNEYLQITVKDNAVTYATK